MKLSTTGLIILAGLFLLTFTSCSDEKNTAQQYSNTMVQSLKSAKSVENKVNVEEVRKSIQEFYAANGRYPADLNEVAAFNGIALKSGGYVYNPATGTLTERQ
jgi:hypothetical protein